MKEQDIIEALQRLEQKCHTALLILQSIVDNIKDIKDEINNK